MAPETQTPTIREAARTPAPFSAWLGMVLLFALFGVIAFAIIGPTPRGSTYEQDRAKKRVEKLQQNRQDQMKAISSYAWVDKAKGTARIPIDRAMELTVAQLAQQKPAPAYPIASPPAASTAQAPATTTAAPAATAPPAEPKGSPRVPKSKLTEQSETGKQPAAAPEIPGAPPGTQPNATATPAASPPAPAANPAQSPQSTPPVGPPGTPIPVPGKTPGQP